jgi:hypothetical protein
MAQRRILLNRIIRHASLLPGGVQAVLPRRSQRKNEVGTPLAIVVVRRVTVFRAAAAVFLIARSIGRPVLQRPHKNSRMSGLSSGYGTRCERLPPAKRRIGGCRGGRRAECALRRCSQRRLPSDTLTYDLQFRLRCRDCNARPGFRITVQDTRPNRQTVRRRPGHCDRRMSPRNARSASDQPMVR